MAQHDDAGGATPLTHATATRRRRRRSSVDEDEEILDAMLNELGIPTSDSKKKKKQQRTNPSEDDVIELITPPRPPRRASEAADAASNSEGKTEEDEPGGSREDSILDLTTPTPPSSAKRAPPRKARHSIVNLLSPDGSESTESDLCIAAESRVESDSESPRRNLMPLLDNTSRGAIHHSGDEDSEEERILRAIAETETRIQLPQLPRPTPAPRGEVGDARQGSRALATPSRDWNRLDSRSDDDDNVSSTPARKKRPRQTKKKAPAPPKPVKEVVRAAVAMEKRLAESPVGAAIQAALEGNSYNNKPVPFVLEKAFESNLNVIQWERRGDARSGEQSEDSSRYVIAMHYPAESFLDLLAGHGYDALVDAVSWVSVESLNFGRKRTVEWGSVVVIVEGMDRALIARSKKNKAKASQTSTQPNASTAPPLSMTFSDLHQLAFRLFMDTSVHTKFTCDTEATASYVALLTREIVIAAAKQTSQEEFLESVPRGHSFRVLPGSGNTLNQFANTWLRMLQMIPGVSEDRAQSVLDHFPTFQSLLRAYNDPSRSVEEKEELLADKLHGSRFESALSRRIFRVFSGWNERDLV